MREVYYDELTGCYNRRFLRYWIDNEIKRATRFATKFSVILLDIDDFRTINNNYGHSEGDKVLITFNQILLASSLFSIYSWYDRSIGGVSLSGYSSRSRNPADR